jgi:hypothetical protein
MTHSPLSTRIRGAAQHMALLCLTIGAAACGTKADFVVTRPALVDYARHPSGHLVQLGSFQNRSQDSRGQTLAQRLQMNMQNAGARALHLHKDLRVVPRDGGLIVSGSVNSFVLEQDRNERRETCRYRVGNETRQTPCTRVSLTARLSSDTVVQVHNRSGELVHSSTISRTASTASGGVLSTVASVNRPPAALDINSLITRVADSTSTQATRIIFPWQQTVRTRFSSCRGIETCVAAIELARMGEMVDAEELMTSAITAYEADATQADPATLASLLRNRSIVRRYSSDFDGAAADLERAISLQPSETTWRGELTGIRTEAAGGIPDDVEEATSVWDRMFGD